MAAKKRFLLRLDQDVYDALERWAADDLRSINGQIEFLLAEALKRSGRRRGKPADRPLASDTTDND